MAYLPKEFAVWTSTGTGLKPNHMERIVFYLKTDTKSAWHCGTYNDTEQTVEIQHSAHVYESFSFGGDGVDYWMRVPTI